MNRCTYIKWKYVNGRLHEIEVLQTAEHFNFNIENIDVLQVP